MFSAIHDRVELENLQCILKYETKQFVFILK